jgi:hypothetical protein
MGPTECFLILRSKACEQYSLLEDQSSVPLANLFSPAHAVSSCVTQAPLSCTCLNCASPHCLLSNTRSASMSTTATGQNDSVAHKVTLLPLSSCCQKHVLGAHSMLHSCTYMRAQGPIRPHALLCLRSSPACLCTCMQLSSDSWITSPRMPRETHSASGCVMRCLL